MSIITEYWKRVVSRGFRIGEEYNLCGRTNGA